MVMKPETNTEIWIRHNQERWHREDMSKLKVIPVLDSSPPTQLKSDSNIESQLPWHLTPTTWTDSYTSNPIVPAHLTQYHTDYSTGLWVLGALVVGIIFGKISK